MMTHSKQMCERLVVANDKLSDARPGAKVHIDGRRNPHINLTTTLITLEHRTIIIVDAISRKLTDAHAPTLARDGELTLRIS